MQLLSETQTLTIALANFPTAVLVLVGILINNHRLNDMKDRLNDMRDLIRAEVGKNHSEMLGKFAELEQRLDQRIERLEQSRWKP